MTTPNGLTAKAKPLQKQTRKVATRVPAAEERPSLRHYPRRVIIIMEEKLPVHAQPPANKIVTTINARHESSRYFSSTKHELDGRQDLVLVVPTTDDSKKMVIEFERWSASSLAKASHAQTDTKTYQVIIQRAYIRNDKDKPMSPAEIERELNENNGINKLGWHYHRTPGTDRTEDSGLPLRMVAFRGETDAHYKLTACLSEASHCYDRDYIET